MGFRRLVRHSFYQLSASGGKRQEAIGKWGSGEFQLKSQHPKTPIHPQYP
ncbi:hypothetical protein MYAER_1444 [Microcystis aeruginosa NIES-2549]|uniref:Uncharacterized protein n=1 Tax=Microcystis aeruginosa NIES-2549 TaxID=1641812 RepID=A0A0F6RKG7_MICAE|nr:hypothetical protein MYAER_1444 [Microcystis aeruginosa NIES-2549]